MVVKVHQSNGDMSSTLTYNGTKVAKGKAEIICVANMPSNRQADIVETFRRRERLRARAIKHVSFQLSVNPGPNDTIREEDIPNFVSELMERMGYGEQPWAIYKHQDIERTHYHVVSIRIDKKGRKIRDFFEAKKCLRVCEELGKRYGFVIGDGETEKIKNDLSQEQAHFEDNSQNSTEKQTKEATTDKEQEQRQGSSTDDKKETKKRPYSGKPSFTKGMTDATGCILACCEDALSYKFTTPKQFFELLRLRNVGIKETEREGKSEFVLQGLDRDGKGAIPPLSEKEIGTAVYSSMERRIAECKAMDLSEERRNAKGKTYAQINRSTDKADLLSRLRKVGIEIVSYKDGQGRITGTTLIDHADKCVFKGSELGRSLGSRLTDCLNDGEQWKEDENYMKEPERREESKSTAEEIVNGALATAIGMLGGGGGNGKDLLDPNRKNKKKKREA